MTYKKFFLLSILLFTPIALFYPNIDAAQDPSKMETMILEKDIQVNPNEDYVVKYDAKSGRLIFPDNKPIPKLPKTAIKALAKAPDWIRKDLQEAFVQLLMDRIHNGKNSMIAFGKVDNDEYVDMIVGLANGNVELYKGPFWKKDEALCHDVKVDGNASPAIADINFDGINDLIVGSKSGRIYSFLGPDFKIENSFFDNFPKVQMTQPVFIDITGNGKPELLVATPNGTISPWEFLDGKWQVSNMKWKTDEVRLAVGDLNGDGKKDLVGIDRQSNIYISQAPDWKMTKLNDFSLPANIGIALADVTNDGLLDFIVSLNNDQGVKYFKNFGTETNFKFFNYNMDAPIKFNIDSGKLSSTAFIDINNDGQDDLLVSNKEGSLQGYIAPNWDKAEKHPFDIKIPYANISSGDIDGDKIKDLVIGGQNGEVTFYLSTIKGFSKPISCVNNFAAPAIGDINGDGKPELVVGSEEEIKFFHLTIAGEKVITQEFKTITKSKDKDDKSGLPYNLSAFSPALFDVNNDKKLDLIVGTRQGAIKAFNIQDMKELDDIMFEIYCDNYSTPCFHDVNKDGKTDLISGNIFGRITYFENIGNDKKHHWQERLSWHRFKEDGEDKIVDRYNYRYPRPARQILGYNDMNTLNTYATMIIKTEENLVDEIAFSIAKTPSEMLRTAARLGMADLYEENAKYIYEVNKALKYVDIIEKENYTTLEYKDKKGKFELPKNIYYWWVVHPRIMWEMPLKIDSSWWKTSPEEHGVSRDEFVKHKETDIFTNKKEAKFWREVLAYDKTYGKSLVEYVSKAETFEDAVLKTFDFVSRRCPDGFMKFGYYSDDDYPSIIYRKAYGSCGEHSIVGAAISRTALIPNATASNFGEDHQWNEYWYRNNWYHCDFNYFPANGICLPNQLACDAKWMTDKIISVVLRTWGDGTHDTTTNKIINEPAGKNTKSGFGYTDTAEVTIVVKDKNGNPIDGVLLFFFSRNRIPPRGAYWGYSDQSGTCKIDLGFIDKGGYTIIVSSPFGSGGVQNFAVRPFEKHHLEIITGSENFIKNDIKLNEIEKQESDPNLFLDAQVTSGTLYTAEYGSTYPKEINKVLSEKTKYNGTRFVKYEQEYANLDWIVFDEENYIKYKNHSPATAISYSKGASSWNLKRHLGKNDLYLVLSNRNKMMVASNVKLKIKQTSSIQKPTVTISFVNQPKNNIYKSSDTLVVQGKAVDNLGIKKLLLSFNNGNDYEDITNCIKSDGEWSFSLSEKMEGPLFPGKYAFNVKAIDFNNNEVISDTLKTEVVFDRKMTKQIIRQDNPKNPLEPKCNWTLGPFYIQNERFVDIKAICKDKSVDLDLWLYFDSNNNGIADSKDSVNKASTEGSNENLFITNVMKGTYWLYVHGWEVPQGKEFFDIDFSFTPIPRLITKAGPTGYGSFSHSVFAEISSIGGIDEKSIVFKVNNIDFSNLVKFQNGKFEIPIEALKNNLLTDGKDNHISIFVKDYLENQDLYEWSFKLDNIAPEITEISPLDRKISGYKKISVKGKDNLALNSISVKAINTEGKEIEKVLRHTENDNYYGYFDFGSLQPGKHTLRIVATDKAGNENIKNLDVRVDKTPDIAFGKVYPSIDATEHSDWYSGDIIYIDRPILQAEIIGNKIGSPEKYKVIFDGQDVSAKSEIRKNLIRYIPAEPIKEGDHTIVFIAVSKDGEEISLEINFKSSRSGKPKIREY